jgi:putative DNA primase/helicase
MDLITFARLQSGVLIDRLVEDGRWHRVPTEDKPKRRNGAYMSRGTYGFVQNHATDTEPVLWKAEGAELANVDREAIRRQIEAAAAKIKHDQELAARKAAYILHNCTQAAHPYLEFKGFPEETGLVWRDPKHGDLKLCIPMRVDGKIRGLQTISDLPAHERTLNGESVTVPAFEKRFLYGQQTMDTSYTMGNGSGLRIFCEGFATGLSVRNAMVALKRRFTLHICFTAGNMARIAGNFKEGLVVADFDLPSKQHPERGGHGLKVAQEIGLPYWLSDTEGEDFNDMHKRLGLFRASQSLLKAIPRVAVT